MYVWEKAVKNTITEKIVGASPIVPPKSTKSHYPRQRKWDGDYAVGRIDHYFPFCILRYIGNNTIPLGSNIIQPANPILIATRYEIP